MHQSIQRYLDIGSELTHGKTLVILGPRRVGKTTLLREFLEKTSQRVLSYSGDEVSTQQAFEGPDSARLRPLLGSAQVLAIDEAQAIPRIGQTLKIINDHFPDIAVVVTGSSAFELAGQVGEPLTGRKTTRYLYPVAVTEMLRDAVAPEYDFVQLLPEWLVYGMYPNALTAESHAQKAEFLRELVDSYLLRDILAYQEVKGSSVLMQLLVLLAHQVGNEVSHTELGRSLGIDKNTVARYLDLLEKSYIIFRLGGFSRNLRSEVTRMPKYYFYDVGVRNAVIGNFNELSLRDDVGRLWENFMVTERLKARTYNRIYANQYFWRTWKQNEIDLIEERDGLLYGYEMKWRDKRVAAPAEWLEAYPGKTQWQTITPQNAWGFLSRD
jgi:predicted AAA+ superfamily ATPase